MRTHEERLMAEVEQARHRMMFAAEWKRTVSTRYWQKQHEQAVKALEFVRSGKS
jgi:hypothetical protein